MEIVSDRGGGGDKLSELKEAAHLLKQTETQGEMTMYHVN